MKNLFLIAAAMLCASAPAMAYQLQFNGEYLTDISPNGQWVAGDLSDGTTIIRNLDTDQFWVSVSNGSTVFYYIGSGQTPVSNVGIVVGSTTMDDAAYWENGKWTQLSVPNPQFTNTARSITPDGSIICGGIGNSAMSVEAEHIMSLPVLWYRQSDGSYGEPFILPHPTKDFTGRAPQYITAYAITPDGKTVAGQVIDNSGFYPQPIIYHCDDAGQWSYTLLAGNLINPTGVEFPPYPGELDDPQPSQEEYMTEEEIAAFTAAFDAWRDDPDASNDDMPTYEEFMTQDEIAAFTAAYSHWYWDLYEPWDAAYSKFMVAFEQVIDKGYVFIMNNVGLTADGKYYATTRKQTIVRPGDVEYSPSITYPILFTTDGSEYTELNGSSSDYNTRLSSLALDGSILGVAEEGILPQRAIIFPIGEKEAMPLEDYIYDQGNPELTEWMEDMMYHDAADGVSESGQLHYGQYMCSGIPFANFDMSYVICATATDGWYEPTEPYYSWAFSTGLNLKVDGVDASQGSIKVLPGGMIELDGDFASLSIYDLTGALLFSTDTTGSTVISTGLPSGLYLIRALSPAGTPTVLKALL